MRKNEFMYLILVVLGVEYLNQESHIQQVSGYHQSMADLSLSNKLVIFPVVVSNFRPKMNELHFLCTCKQENSIPSSKPLTYCL